MSNLPKYVFQDTDRHGTVRYYYRRNGHKTRLRNPFGSNDFFKELTGLMGGDSIEYHPRRVKDSDVKQFIYFVCYGRKVKIGISQNWYQRYEQIRRGLPGHATILYVTPGSRQLERELHHRFAEDRLSGEWFAHSQQIEDWIEDNRRARIANKTKKILTHPPDSLFYNWLISKGNLT